jgi:hypothetical protein
MDQVLDKLKEALSRLLAEAESFALTVESLLNSFSKKLSILTAEALGHVKHVGSFLNEFSEFLSSRLTELPGFLPPVAQQLSIPMLGGLLLTVLFLLLVLSRSRRAKAGASKEFGKEITFEDISAETADSAFTTNADTSASQVEPTRPVTQNTIDNPNENASAQANGFTFFRRKASTRECGAAPLSDTSSGEEDYTSNNASTSLGDNDVLEGLEQEMLATRQLYLDGTISKEVYVSETRALYQKAKSRMT